MASLVATQQQLHSSLFSQPPELKSLRFSPIQRSNQSSVHPSSLPIVAHFSNISPADVKDKSYTSSGAAKEIPGSYGLPLLGVAIDRFKYFVLQGRDEYFLSKMQRYNSTVIRLNMPPGRPLFPDSRTIMLLDQKSMPVLFDTSRVEKKDVFAGTYMPSTSFTGGYRVLSYLDPSEPKHTALKEFCFDMLKSNGRKFLPEFRYAFLDAAADWDAQLEAKGEADFTTLCQSFTFKFLCKSFLNADPTASGSASLGTNGPTYIQAWTAAQLIPQTSLGLPKIIEGIFHTIPIPPFLVSGPYKKLFNFFYAHAQRLLDVAESKFSLNRVEACHNVVFFVCFNTWGGMQILYPSIIEQVASMGVGFQKELAQEVRSAVGPEGEITMKALDSMKLLQSTVHEVLRVDPPVPFQYGHAKEDMIIESHDASYKVKKGELLACYQKIAMRDAKVFQAPQTFDPKRFMGEEGEKLLQNLTWSNGPESGEPAVSNKQCPGKNFVNLIGQLLLAEIFLTYDYFKIGPVKKQGVRSSFKFKVLKKRTPGV